MEIEVTLKQQFKQRLFTVLLFSIYVSDAFIFYFSCFYILNAIFITAVLLKKIYFLNYA